MLVAVVVTMMGVAGSPVSALTTYYMATLCGQQLSLAARRTKALSLELTSAQQYDPHMNCYISVIGEAGSQIMTSFEWVDINSFRHCPGDFLQIVSGYQGMENQSASEAVTIAPVCGKNTPDTIISRDNNVTLRFVSDGHFFGKGFHLVFTQFYNGPCREEEFSCDNGRCVHADLACGYAGAFSFNDDSFNHCGDFSTRCRIPPLTIISIVLFCLVFVLVVFVLTVVVWYRMRLAKPGDDDEETGGDGEVNEEGADGPSEGVDNEGYTTAGANCAVPRHSATSRLPSVSSRIVTSVSLSRAITEMPFSFNFPLP